MQPNNQKMITEKRIIRKEKKLADHSIFALDKTSPKDELRIDWLKCYEKTNKSMSYQDF